MYQHEFYNLINRIFELAKENHIMKKNEGKPKISLVYKSFVEEISKVREFGNIKHGNPEGWRTTKTREHYDACLRHLFTSLDGEILDKESGLLHLSHAACNLMFLIEEIANGGTVNTNTLSYVEKEFNIKGE